MKILQNKLFVSLFIVLAIALCIQQWFSFSKTAQAKEDVIAFMKGGYKRQFCSVVYPKIKECVTLSENQCEAVVDEAIEPCIDSAAASLGSDLSREAIDPVHLSLGVCFEHNIHEMIYMQYMVNTEECKARLS